MSPSDRDLVGNKNYDADSLYVHMYSNNILEGKRKVLYFPID